MLYFLCDKALIDGFLMISVRLTSLFVMVIGVIVNVFLSILDRFVLHLPNLAFHDLNKDCLFFCVFFNSFFPNLITFHSSLSTSNSSL